MLNPYAPPQTDLEDQRGNPGAVQARVHPPAPLVRRGLAALLDQLLATAITGLLLVPLSMVTPAQTSVWVDGLSALGLILIIGLSFGLLEGSGWQATPGKKLLGLRVIRHTGGRVSRSKALKRNLFKYLGLNLCGLLAITAVNSSGRSIWDRAIGTRVVQSP
jgi:uncharacterized RDD family membrane protein YckC